MNNKKLFLGFATVVLLLTTLSKISSFILSFVCAIIALLIAITAIAAIKSAVLAVETFITRNYSTKEENKKITVVGRITALTLAFIGITSAALAVFIAVNIGGIAGMLAIPMLTALYLYNYEGKMIQMEITPKNKNEYESTAVSEDYPSTRIEIKDLCCQLICNTLTDVNDNLLYGLGNYVCHCVRNFCNKGTEPVFTQVNK